MTIIDELFELCKSPPSRKVWDRFWNKTSVNTWSNCWKWENNSSFGYGYFSLKASGNKVKRVRAHRLICHWLYGQLPNNLVVDHIWCNNPACINPLHLIPTTHRVNILRSSVTLASKNLAKTHCPKGHPYIALNIIQGKKKSNRRACRLCSLEYASQRRLEKGQKTRGGNYKSTQELTSAIIDAFENVCVTNQSLGTLS